MTYLKILLDIARENKVKIDRRNKIHSSKDSIESQLFGSKYNRSKFIHSKANRLTNLSIHFLVMHFV